MKTSHFTRCLVLAIIPLLVSVCSKSDDRSRAVEMPPIEKGCLSGQCVKGQFETSYQRFALVNGNGVNLRNRPDMSSRVLAKLPVTRKITVLHIMTGEVTIGGLKGHWAFVRDASNLHLQGWIFDRFVGYRDSFKKISSWKLREVRMILGGRLTVYRCTPDGRFEVTQNEMIYKKDGARRREKISGEIYALDNIIWFRKEGADDHPVFFHRTSGENLELPEQYRDSRGIIMTH